MAYFRTAGAQGKTHINVNFDNKKQCIEGECFTWELLGRIAYYSHHPKLPAVHQN